MAETAVPAAMVSGLGDEQAAGCEPMAVGVEGPEHQEASGAIQQDEPSCETAKLAEQAKGDDQQQQQHQHQQRAKFEPASGGETRKKFTCHQCSVPISDKFIMKLYPSATNSNKRVSQGADKNSTDIFATTNTNNKLLNAVDLNVDENCLLYHEHCLRCHICRGLLDKSCFVHENKLLCPLDYYG